MPHVLVADVAIDSRSGGTEAVYTYRSISGLGVGDACIVPLGNRSNLGYVVRIYETDGSTLGFPLESLREVLSKVAGFGVDPASMALAEFVSREYLCPLPVVLGALIPPGVKNRLVTAWKLTGEPATELSPLQMETFRTIRDAGGTLIEANGKPIDAPILRALKLLRARGVVQSTMMIQPLSDRNRSEAILSLSPDASLIETFLTKEGKKKPAQAMTLMRLQASEHPLLKTSEIKAMAGVTDTTIKSLVSTGLLVPQSSDPGPVRQPPEPNQYQRLAIDTICDSVSQRESKTYLLYGVTGSGKTEVYLRCAAEALAAGRQVLYLVPEIALATQAITQLRERFGGKVTVLHSELAMTERLENHLRIRRGECPVVLGARSAVFASLHDIGLIVMDEEHEASYKQESAPRYHTKTLARFLSQFHGCPLVLGSATPSVESFFEAEKEKITLLNLPQRAASAKLPQVFIDDLTTSFKSGTPTILGELLTEKLTATLERGEQAILFLNRRAYSSFLLCRDCGKDFRCPNCSVALSFHLAQKRLKCHHCGFLTRPPDTCPSCGGSRVKGFGLGTERVQEAVQLLFPERVVARLDRDVAQKKGALEQTLADFRSQASQVLVGTQMVAKGLDFPNVTLVGVIAADISINLPDFRSSERTFQLLSQVAGRAGRGSKPGEVVIQTFQPEHISVATAQVHDYLKLYEEVRDERSEVGYPPFRRLVNMLFTGEDVNAVIRASEDAKALLAPIKLEGVDLLGPVDCALERVQGRWRRHILLKFPDATLVSRVGELLTGFQVKGVQWTLDVDPFSLM